MTTNTNTTNNTNKINGGLVMEGKLNLKDMLMRFKKEDLLNICTEGGIEVTIKDTKDILSDKVIEVIDNMCDKERMPKSYHSALCEKRDNVLGKRIKNDNILPIGGYICKEFEGRETILAIEYKKEILREKNTLESIMFVTPVKDVKVLVVNTLEEYKLIRKVFGTFVINPDAEYVEGYDVVEGLNYERVAKYFNGITFGKKLVKDVNSVYSSISLFSVKGGTTIFFDKAFELSYILNREDLEKQIDYYLPKKKTVKRSFRTKNISILDLEVKGSKYVLSKYNKRVYTKLSESRVARVFGRKRLVKVKTYIDGEVQDMLKEVDDLCNFSTFSCFVDDMTAKAFLLKERGIDVSNLEKSERRELLDETVDMLKERVNLVLTQGYYDEEEDKTLIPVARTASQSRVGKVTFSSEDWHVVSKALFCGDEDAILKDGKANPAKYDARKALQFTNSTPVSAKPRVFVYKDTKEVAYVDTVKCEKIIPKCGDLVLNYNVCDRSKVERAVRECTDKSTGVLNVNQLPAAIKKNLVNTPPMDGQSVGTVEFMTEINCDLNIITKFERDYFLRGYARLNLAKLRKTRRTKLLNIFAKMVKVVQFRHGGDKGIVVMDDFNKRVDEYKDYDILMGTSVRKYFSESFIDEEGRSTLEFSVVNVNKKKKGNGFLNYQVINASDIPANELINLAEEAFGEVGENVLKDPVCARMFLGLMHSDCDEEDDDYENKKLVSILTRALESCPELIKDEYINSKLKFLVGKYIWDIAFGRIPVEGNYYFLVTDPMYATNKSKCLQRGQNYLNGYEGEVVLARNPLIHHSEVRKIRVCNVERLWYLTDCMVLNPFDGILPCLGGADVDGDKALCIVDFRLIKYFKNDNYIIFDDREATPVECNITPDILSEHYKNTVNASMIGIITDYATYFRDLQLSGFSKFRDYTGRVHDIDDLIKKLRFIQGWDIDKAKNDYEVILCNFMKVNKKPAWLAYRKAFHKDSKTFIEKDGRIEINEDVIDERSNSPLQQLFNYSMTRVPELLSNKGTTDKSLVYSLLKTIDKSAYETLRPKIAKLEKQYREKVGDLLSTFYFGVDKNRLSKEEMQRMNEQLSEQLEELYERYRYKLISFCKGNKEVLDCIVATSYDVCYNRKSEGSSNYVTKSRSFVWNVFKDELTELLAKNTKGDSLVLLPSIGEEINEVVVNNVGALFLNHRFIKMTSIPAGSYEPITFKDKTVIKTPRIKLTMPSTYLEEKVTKFIGVSDMTLSVAVNGATIKETLDAIKENGFKFSVQEHDNSLWVVVNNKPICLVTNFGLNNLEDAANKVFSINGFGRESYMYQPSKYESRTDKNIAWVDEDKIFAYKKETTIDVKFIRDNTVDETLTQEEFLSSKPIVKAGDVVNDSMDYSDIEAYESLQCSELDIDSLGSLDDNLEAVQCDVSFMDDFDESDIDVATDASLTCDFVEDLNLEAEFVSEEFDDSILNDFEGLGTL